MYNKVLVVDDELAIRQTISDILNDENIATETAASAEESIALLDLRKDFGAALVDVWMAGMNGIEFLEYCQQKMPDFPVIIMSGHGNIEHAVRATKMGAYDFLEKPLSYDKIILTVSNAIRQYSLITENRTLAQSQTRPASCAIIGNSQLTADLRKQIQKVAPTDSRVLISGGNGTGKELVAQHIHSQSERRNKPFVEVNCAAIPEELIESELFGHEKGSFTGATSKKTGKFDQANGGTLFLDEVADMSLRTQAKILRVLQESRYERVGGQEVISVNVRVIAASNKHLPDEITAGNFREDLYYRLNVLPIHVPSLHERAADIPILVEHFIDEYAKKNHVPPKRVEPAALECLQNYPWPGNIRELKNIVERMMILGQENLITTTDIPHAIRTSQQNRQQAELIEQGAGWNTTNFKEARDNFERNFLTAMLEKYEWNITKTSKEIQLERSNLYKKMKQLGINTKTDNANT